MKEFSKYESVFVRNVKEKYLTKKDVAFNAAIKRIIDLEDSNRKLKHAMYLICKTKKVKYTDFFKPTDFDKEFHKFTSGDVFYKSKAWLNLRYEFISSLSKKKCKICGNEDELTQFHVDHIKARSVFPELSLEMKNLQLLCKDCNLGKSNKVFGLNGFSKPHPEYKRTILRKSKNNV